MPISVVVGGQFGSEGKGKVALEIARQHSALAVVRVGGTNSGHTAIDVTGRLWAFRQLPVSVLSPNAVAVLPPGSVIDPAIFLHEVSTLGLSRERIYVSPYATVISQSDRDAERRFGLVEKIGSTGSGTGAALMRRMKRQGDSNMLAKDHEGLQPYLQDTSRFMRTILDKNRRIVIEGSQGFGLSLLHGGYYPKATSRDTTAAAFVGEAGLSPRDVDDVTLVIRAHPIRVAGDSGPLLDETTWNEIAKEAGLPDDYRELTTATKKVRRVGTFDPAIVRRAIDVNNPNQIALNHLDYVDVGICEGRYSPKAISFLQNVETKIGRKVDWIGTGPAGLIPRSGVSQTRQLQNLKMAIPS